jgi:hypothetical protein
MARPARTLEELLDVRGQSRPRIDRGRPRISKLAYEPGHRIARGGDVNRQRGPYRHVEAERTNIRLHGQRNSLAAEQRTDLAHHPAHARSGRLERRVVQALRALRSAGAKSECTPTARHRMQRRRGHGDRRGATIPDPDDSRAERDAPRARDQLAEEHGLSYAHVSGMKKPSYPRQSPSVATALIAPRRVSSAMTERPSRWRIP